MKCKYCLWDYPESQLNKCDVCGDPVCDNCFEENMINKSYAPDDWHLHCKDCEEWYQQERKDKIELDIMRGGTLL